MLAPVSSLPGAAWLRTWRCLPLVLSSLALPAFAAPATASPVQASDPAAWVERIGRAAQRHNYSGTWVYTAADVVSSTRVARFGVGGQVYERTESLDGVQQQSFRHNEQVHTVWPAAKVVTVERVSPQDPTTGLPQVEPRLLSHYDVRVLGTDRVAGRAAAVLLLKPRDELRFAQRIWADRDTGLLLRADVLSPQGQVLESSAFSDVEVDARPTRDQMLNPARRANGWRVVQVGTEPATLESEGWAIDRPPAGFRLLACLQRMVGQPGDPAAGRLSRALQAVFSDGLARVSVFIEPADAARPREPLMTNLGATHTLIKPREGRWWITVMGDVPPATLKAFFDATLRRP